MIHFDKVISEYLLLKPEFQDSIQDITQKMGYGMAEFVGKKMETLEDYNLYCHYVAGLVGIGLSRLFAASRLEGAAIGNNEPMANSMGLFLQKTNIIRDFHEDFHQGRIFWPKQIWSSYTKDLSEFCEKPSLAVHCSNELILDSLKCIPDCIHYLSMLNDAAVFNFCAIPQVMAIATLALCFNNQDIFRRHIKISRGTAVRLIMQSTNLDEVKAIFVEFANVIARKIEPYEPQYMEVQLAVGRVKALCMKSGTSVRMISMIIVPLLVAVFSILVSLFVYASWDMFS